MKSKVALLGLVSFLFTGAVLAQGIENDDMYFNSKDRAKLNAAKATEVSYSASIKKNKKVTAEDEPVNPTDSYSARNVNPEYSARSNAQAARADNQDYFVDNYKYNNASNFNNWNNNFSNRYNSPWYSTNYWGPSINSWNSPYYGSYYDSWGNPWSNPYYQSGWSSSFSYSWGRPYNYGWGMGFGYGNPYCAYNPYYGGGYGYSAWNSYYGGGYGYPTQVVVIENGNQRGPVYGKRDSRSSQLNRDSNHGSTRTSRAGLVDSGNGGRSTTGGRVDTNTPARNQSDYYNRQWRNQTNESNSSTYSPNTNSSSGNTNTRSSWENNSRSSWRESNSSNGSTYTPSQSSGSSGRSSGGSGSSSGGSSGGSSSGSRSGGRGH